MTEPPISPLFSRRKGDSNMYVFMCPNRFAGSKLDEVFIDILKILPKLPTFIVVFGSLKSLSQFSPRQLSSHCFTIVSVLWMPSFGAKYAKVSGYIDSIMFTMNITRK